MIILKPVQRHITIVAIAIFTPHQPEFHGTGSAPIVSRSQFAIPLLLNIALNTRVTATMDVMLGIKYRTRNVFLNFVIAELRKTAKNSAKINCGTVPIKLMINVLLKEVQKIGSSTTN